MALPSLRAPGGGFDVPKSKCPPDRGSSDCVTGRPASTRSSSRDIPYRNPLATPPKSKPNSYETHAHAHAIIYPPTPPLDAVDHTYRKNTTRSGARSTSPVSIPFKNSLRHNRSINHQLATPPLSPEHESGISTSSHKDALDFLLTIFPSDGLSVLPFAKAVDISAPNMGAKFDGAVVELAGRAKTLYVDGKSAQAVSLRESIVALLDLADDSLGCAALVIALERSSPALGNLLHSLMYVGGTVVTKPPFRVDPAYVLVGMEI